MSGEHFLDTNILIYAVGNIQVKKEIAVGLLSKNAVISLQIITESVNVMRRKLGYDYSQIRCIADKFVEKTRLCMIRYETVRKAVNIAERYGYMYYDSQIIASALENGCDILYSEDLQHGQIIEKRLTIVNPFLISKQ